MYNSQDVQLNLLPDVNKQLYEIQIFDKINKKSLFMLAPKLYQLLLEGKSSVKDIKLIAKETSGDLERRDLQSNLLNGLHFASIGMNLEVLEYILQEIKNVNAITMDGYTALHVIVIYGDTHHLNFKPCYSLLMKKIKPEILDLNNSTAFNYLKKLECVNAIEMCLELKPPIIEAPITTEESIYCKFFKMLRHNKNKEIQRKFVEEILSSKENLVRDAKCGITLLQFAVYTGNKLAVSALLRRKVNPNETCDEYPITPLDLCIEKGDADCFKLLITNDNLRLQNPEAVWIKICELGNVGMIEGFLQSNQLIKDEIKEVIPYVLFIEMPQSTILALLKNDVMSLADRNRNGYICAGGIKKIAFSRHLDSCVKRAKSETDRKSAQEKKPSMECFDVKFELDYKTLMPSFPTRYYSELDLFMYILNERPDLRLLLLHVVIKCFILMKWHSISTIFWINVSFHILWCLALIASIFAKIYFHYLVAATLIFYTFKDISQKKFKNLYILKYILLSVLLWLNWESSLAKIWDILSAISLVLVAYKLLRCAGQSPKFSIIFCTFQSVLNTFLEYLSFYLVLIIPFALSFHILLRNHDVQNNPDNAYNNPFTSIFKTLIMLSGEFEAGAIDFNKYPYFSHVAFLSYIFVIVITLMNLLNGVAVSETKKAQDGNELNAIKAQLRYIYSIECLTNTKVTKFFLNCFTKNFQFFKKTEGKVNHKIFVTNSKTNTRSVLQVDPDNSFKYTCEKIMLGKYVRLQNINNNGSNNKSDHSK